MGSSDNVRNMRSGGRIMRPEAPWLRRHAIQLAAQLPEDEDDALRVIEYLIEIQRDFLSGRTREDKRNQEQPG